MLIIIISVWSTWGWPDGVRNRQAPITYLPILAAMIIFLFFVSAKEIPIPSMLLSALVFAGSSERMSVVDMYYSSGRCEQGFWHGVRFLASQYVVCGTLLKLVSIQARDVQVATIHAKFVNKLYLFGRHYTQLLSSTWSRGQYLLTIHVFFCKFLSLNAMLQNGSTLHQIQWKSQSELSKDVPYTIGKL